MLYSVHLSPSALNSRVPRQLPKFEVLVGDQRAVRWVDCEGCFDPDKCPARPVEGGKEADGTPLFIAQGHYNNAIVPGKCSTHLKAAFVPYAQSEKEVKVRPVPFVTLSVR